jgi:tetratricopeptide (TPR) repeat protein
VDTRQRWQALQSRIGEARTALNTGDRARALHALDAALEIDPDYLVAQTMRAQLVEQSEGPKVEVSRPEMPAPAPVNSPLPGDAYARLEERAKRRRVLSRVAAAHAAIAESRLEDAAAAIEEVRDLDPELPELTLLARELDNGRARASYSGHPIPWAVAATICFGLLVAGLWLQNAPPPRLSQERSADPAPTIAPPDAAQSAAAPHMEPDQQLAVLESSPAILEAVPDTLPSYQANTASDESGLSFAGRPSDGSGNVVAVNRPPERSAPIVAETPAATTGSQVALPEPIPTRVPEPAPQATRVVETAPQAASSTTVATLPKVFDSPAVAPGAESSSARLDAPSPPAFSPSDAPATADVRPVPRVAEAIDERQLVQRVLQRYRSAYQDLDAESARAVWPAVNASALARAFDGLESQTLTFQDCEVQLAGAAARAVCLGTTQYVPKVGSREPRVEPRRWSFSLKKEGDDWKIENARAER